MGTSEGRTSQAGHPARIAALRLLRAVLAEGRPLDEMTRVLEPLEPADRARARRLADAALRGAGRAELLLAPRLDRPPPADVRAALLLGVAELAAGSAAHGVVNDLVSIVGADRRTARFRGLVNAVLRRMAEDVSGWDLLPVPRLPEGLRAGLVAAWGEAAVAAMEAVHAAPPPLDLTARGDPEALARATGGRLLPTGSVRLRGQPQVSALPGYDDGAFWVQDAAAALPARFFGDVRGARVLDLCAAPGGKTMQLAAAGAEVTALDPSPARMALLRANLARTGLGARTLVADARDFGEEGWDAILLDAPCSATGTIRRNPDLAVLRPERRCAALVPLQAGLIDRAVALLRPGGRLVFCTCSVLPQEGEEQLRAALARHPGLAVSDIRPEGVDPGWRSAEGGWRLRPDLWAEMGGLDGFYIAALDRRG